MTASKHEEETMAKIIRCPKCQSVNTGCYSVENHSVYTCYGPGCNNVWNDNYKFKEEGR